MISVKTAGIVCEYNPFHSGHKWQIQETRRALGEDAGIVCVMSGNFVQRGDMAVFSKHARAEAAVICGADLVIELPAAWSVSSAERFALGAVGLLNGTGICTHVSFGSELGDVVRLCRVARCLGSSETDDMIVKELQSGISYAAARQRAVGYILGEDAEILESPNNILAVEYIKALNRLTSKMEPVAIRRVGAGHDEAAGDDVFASASMIRELLLSDELADKYIPDGALKVFKDEIAAGRGPVTSAASETAILARLRVMGEEEFAMLPGGSEGLYMRLMKCAASAPTLAALMDGVKSKRYAMSRIRRMVIAAYLGIKASDSNGLPPYIRPLAFNQKGQELLKQMKTASSLPVITKPASVRELGSREQYVFSIEARATDLYSLAYPSPEERTGGREWTTSPLCREIDI